MAVTKIERHGPNDTVCDYAIKPSTFTPIERARDAKRGRRLLRDNEAGLSMKITARIPKTFDTVPRLRK